MSIVGGDALKEFFSKKSLKRRQKRIQTHFLPISGAYLAREICRLQAFPDSYQYHPKQYSKQMGNAVNVKVVQHVAEWLLGVDVMKTESDLAP